MQALLKGLTTGLCLLPTSQICQLPACLPHPQQPARGTTSTRTLPQQASHAARHRTAPEGLEVQLGRQAGGLTGHAGAAAQVQWAGLRLRMQPGWCRWVGGSVWGHRRMGV